MPRRVPLPPEFTARPFSVGAGHVAGLGRERLRGADLVTPYSGVRLASVVDLDFTSRCAALDLRLQSSTGFSHLTAARLWGVPLAEPFSPAEPLHVTTVLPATRPRLRGVCGHTAAVGTTFCSRTGLRVTDPATTWLALASVLSLDELVVAGDHFVLTSRKPTPGERRPYVDLEALGEAVDRSRGRHVRKAREAFALVRDGAESRQETRLRLAMLRRGLPEPDLNVDVFDARGRWLGRGDMVYPKWRVIVEYDGDQHRTDARQYDRDITRHDDFTAAGYRHVRVRRFGMGSGPASGAARAEAALRAAGWTRAAASRSQ
jgi:hypothetical protein